MFKNFHFIIILMISKLTISFKSIDLCTREPENDCQNKKCANACLGKYNFKCSNKICTIDRFICDEYELVYRLIKLVKKSSYFENEIKVFEAFSKYISTCPYVWQPDDICLNEKKCIQTQKIISDNGPIFLRKKVVCLCEDEHSYNCGKYCARNKNSCEEFFSENTNGSVINQKIKSCKLKN